MRGSLYIFLIEVQKYLRYTRTIIFYMHLKLKLWRKFIQVPNILKNIFKLRSQQNKNMDFVKNCRFGIKMSAFSNY